MKEQWIQKKRNIYNVQFDNIKTNGNIYINECLTTENNNLFWKARNRGREKNYKYVWVKNGKIFVKKDPNAATIRVKIEKDLSKIN